MQLIIVIISIFAFLSLSKSATRKKVENLFGDLYQEEIYSGYLSTKREGDELFYVYVPAINNPHIAPLVLWLNGGPGCSSLYGLLAEVGPVVSDNYERKFKVNPYNWNKDTNLLVIEQPAGVGFSKIKDPEFEYNDKIGGENLFYALKDFLNEYSMKNREFYITGYSYAGVYIPILATYILEDNSDDKINLKGILIGNGLTDSDTDIQRSMVEFGFWHGIISLETYDLFEKYCLHKPDELHPEKDYIGSKSRFFPRNVTHKCNEIREEIKNNFEGIDIYGIYRPCPKGNQIYGNDILFHNSKNIYRKTILEKNENYNKIKEELEPEIDIWPESCKEDLFFYGFLNEENIKSKLGVDNSIIWTQCFSGLKYKMGDSFKFYNETMRKYPNISVWHFSGTEDAVVPTLGTMRWINKLNFTIEKEWTQYEIDNQVSGFVQKYKEGIVFITVKGAGHNVPQNKRDSAFKIFDSFIKGKLPYE